LPCPRSGGSMPPPWFSIHWCLGRTVRPRAVGEWPATDLRALRIVSDHLARLRRQRRACLGTDAIRDGRSHPQPGRMRQRLRRRCLSNADCGQDCRSASLKLLLKSPAPDRRRSDDAVGDADPRRDASPIPRRNHADCGRGTGSQKKSARVPVEQRLTVDPGIDIRTLAAPMGSALSLSVLLLQALVALAVDYEPLAMAHSVDVIGLRGGEPVGCW